MAIQDDSSVALIPSAYGTSKVYSVIPSNGNGDFTFSRSGNATRVNKGGYIETMGSNVPRLDYPLIDGVVQDCPALLLEPQRTNYSIYSQDTSTWTYTEFGSGSAGTITTGKTDMFGGTNAVQVDFPSDAENVSVRFGHTSSSISSGTVSLTLYIKLVSSGSKNLQLRASASDIINVNSTEFVRYEVSGTKSSSEALQLKLRPSDGTSSGGFSIIICHPQEEVGSYATSYIPTSGFAETRSADTCNGSGTSAEFNDSEGVLFAEIKRLDNDDYYRVITITDSTTNNKVGLNFRNTTNLVWGEVTVGGVIQAQMQYTANNLAEFNKIAIKYKENDFALWFNGTQVLTDSSGSVFSSNTLTELAFDDGSGAFDFYGNTKQVMTFKTALTDSELETLTSWDSFNAMAKGQLYTIE